MCFWVPDRLYFSDSFCRLHWYSSRWWQVTFFLSEFLNNSFKQFVQKHWFIQAQYNWLYSSVSHWIIHSTDLFKSADSFRNKTNTIRFTNALFGTIICIVSVVMHYYAYNYFRDLCFIANMTLNMELNSKVDSRSINLKWNCVLSYSVMLQAQHSFMMHNCRIVITCGELHVTAWEIMQYILYWTAV